MTGGTGFIGSHTVEHLLQLGHNVRCLIRPGRENLGWLEGLPTENIRADLQNPASLETLVRGIDFVFHIAGVTKAKRTREYFSGNVESTTNLLEATARHGNVKKFCLVSSLTAVGPSKDGTPVDESTPCAPLTEYGRSKLQAERVTRSYADRLPVVIIRPPAVYGPRDRDILELFRTAKWGFRPVIGSKNKTLSLIHAVDVARALVTAAVSQKSAGQVYFATNEPTYRYEDLYHELSLIVGHSTVSLPVPNAVLYSLAAGTELVSVFGPRPAILSVDKARDLVQSHWVCSGKKIREHLGFSTTVEIRDGLRSTFEWYKSRGWLSLKTMFGGHN
ncbi:MAG: NAD-dependent epimerase/dehydratase family protein [Ignavibacteriales bacterium]|nr:NAD-dependent epimerase/dehydratase family protein [Ignavibacteriales bacterium]